MSGIDSPRARAFIGAGWLTFATVNATLMYALPGEETIPYHLIWASFAYLYGLTTWARSTTWVVFSGITVVTGVAIVRHAVNGIIGWEECSEILLMGVIAALLVWHVNRHQLALRKIDELRNAEQARARNRELATRFGSHELRTRLTIARGLTDLIRQTTADERTSGDATLAVGELDKATSLATSLMTFVRADASLARASLDIDELVDDGVRRWAARADREWVAAPMAGTVVATAERIEAALDCLLENAVKFTMDGDRISIDAHLDGPELVLAVADSGAGIPPEELGLVTELFHTSSTAGDRAGSGLGLSIVRATAEAHGGTMRIASTLGQGTQVTIRIPHGNRTPLPIENPVGRNSTLAVHAIALNHPNSPSVPVT